MAEAFVMLAHSDASLKEGFHALGGLADALEHHTSEVFSMVTDPGHLREWEREQRARRRGPMLSVVE